MPTLASPPTAPLRRLAHQPGLDNLRGVAALSVCLFHFGSGMLPERELVEFTQNLFSRGYLGIMLFFVISGYIIPYSLLRQGYQLRHFGAYLKRRLIRINPPAYAAMLLTLLVWAIDDHFIRHGASYRSPVSAMQLVHNILFTVPFTSHNWVVGAAWTLAIELQFYLFIGLLFPLLFTRPQPGWWLAGGYLLVCGLFWLLPAQLSFPLYAPLFALGGAVLLWQQGRLSWLGFAAFLLLFGALALYQVERGVSGTGLTSALTGLLSVAAILLVTRPIPGLAFVGKISYSLYLTHMLAGRTAEFLAIRLMAPDSDLHRTINLVICVLAALAFATAFYYWVEQPCIQLAKRVRS